MLVKITLFSLQQFVKTNNIVKSRLIRFKSYGIVVIINLISQGRDTGSFPVNIKCYASKKFCKIHQSLGLVTRNNSLKIKKKYKFYFFMCYK